MRLPPTRTLLAGATLAAVLLICVLVARPTSGLSIPLKRAFGHGPKYVKSLSVSNLGSQKLAFAWVAETEKDWDALWVCIVSRDLTGALILESGPRLVEDHCGIDNVTVVTHGDQFGLVYSRSDKQSTGLVYRWPWRGARHVLTTPMEQGVMTSTAIEGPGLSNIALAQLIQLQGTSRPTIELVGYVTSPSETTVNHLARIYVPPAALRQPRPQMFQSGQGFHAGVVISLGALVSAEGPIDSIRTTEWSAGELVTLRLSVTPRHRLAIDEVKRFALPADHELRYAGNIAFVDSSMKVFVTAGTIARLVSLAGDSARTVQLSSSWPGCGDGYGLPTVQAMTMHDKAIVAWIDGQDESNELTMPVFDFGYDPTAYGGGIRACRVTRAGEVLPDAVRGFPIKTRAQCIRMGQLGGRPFIAWVEARYPLLSYPPRPTALRIKFF